MTVTAKALLAFLIIALVVGAWMGRYDVQTANQGFGAVVHDRWTGRVYSCSVHRDNDADDQCGDKIRLYP